MKHTGLRSFTYHTVIGLGWTAGAMGAGVGFLNRIPTGEGANTPLLIQDLVKPLQESIWWAVPTAGLVASICVLTLKMMGKPWVWEFIHDRINEFRDFVFRQHQGQHHFRHQVTLFRRYSWYHLWSLCNLLFRLRRFTFQPLLIPVARSVDMNQRTSSCFIVSYSGTTCEGLAGKIWASKTTQFLADLPEATALHDADKINNYAQQAGVSAKWVRKRIKSKKNLARALYGFPIRVKGPYWGVVVLDSVEPDGIDEATVLKQYSAFGTLLSKLLERV